MRLLQRQCRPLLVLLLLSLFISVLAFFAYRTQSRALEKQALDNLQAVATLKASAVAQALADQRVRAIITSRAPVFGEFLRRGAEQTNAADRGRMMTLLEEVRSTSGMNNLWLTDNTGHRLVAARDVSGDDSAWSDAARRAVTSGKVTFVDLHADAPNGTPVLGFAAPVPATTSDARPSGAVVVDIAASALLYPQLLAWPVASTTGRAMMIRRDGDDILYLSPMRRTGNPPLYRQPLGDSTLVAARTLRGETGPMIGTDMRGVAVLAASAPVPGTAWVLITKMDRGEALAEVTRLAIGTGIATFAALIASILLVFLIEQRSRLNAALDEIAHDRALEAARTQFHAVFEQAAVGIAQVSTDGKWLQVNQRFCDMVGYREPELLARTVLDITHPDDRAASAARFRSDELDDRPLEKRYIRRDGSMLWVAVFLRRVSKADGSTDYCVAVIEDITERRRAEQELNESRRHADELLALLDTLQAEAPIGFGFVDREFRYVRVNGALAAINGAPAADHIGHHVRDIVPDIWPRLEPIYRSVLETGRSFLNLDMRRKTSNPSGTLGNWLASFYPVRVGETVIGIGTILVDISESRRLATQLQQAQKMEAIGNLTGGMAHDFNNLLGVVIGNLDLVRPMIGPDNKDANEIIGDAMDAALSGADLTRRLLAFARRQPLQPQRIAINDLVANTVKLLSRTLGENIEISLDLGDGIWPVVVDPAQVEAALVNLANNARDAMPTGGRLMIATGNRSLDADYVELHPEATAGDFVVVEMSDTGTGMTPEVLAKIFEPFFTTKEFGKGTGLGLSMVFGFMQQSGGHVSVCSEPGVGTTFRLYLPRAVPDVADVTEPSGAAPVQAASEIVLVVEDNEALRRVVVRQLVDLGYRVITAASAAEALTLLERATVDLVFTDIVMPGGMDGFDLAQQVLIRWPEVKIVLTSGFPDTKLNSSLGSLALSTRLLAKPYRKEELARILREALVA